MAAWTYFAETRNDYHNWYGTFELHEFTTNVPLTLDLIRESCRILAAEITPNAFIGIEASLRSLQSIWGEVSDRIRKGETIPGPDGTRRAFWHDPWVSLRQLTDVALPSSHLLRPIYDLGVAVGTYDLGWNTYEGPCESNTPDDQTGQPNPHGLIAAADALQDSILSRSAMLHSLSRVGPEPGSSWLIEFFAENELATAYHNDRGWYPNMCALARDLFRIIELELGNLESTDLTFRLPDESGPATPRWVAESGELFLGEMFVCRYEKQATTCREIIEVFQDRSWADSIPSSALKNPSPDLSKTVSRLNAKTKHIIKFNYKSNKIYWKRTLQG